MPPDFCAKFVTKVSQKSATLLLTLKMVTVKCWTTIHANIVNSVSSKSSSWLFTFKLSTKTNVNTEDVSPRNNLHHLNSHKKKLVVIRQTRHLTTHRKTIFSCPTARLVPRLRRFRLKPRNPKVGPYTTSLANIAAKFLDAVTTLRPTSTMST